MLEEQGVIVAVDDTHAWVETQRQSSCGSCGVNKSCGTSVLQKVLGQKRTRLKVLNQSNYQPGDAVVLGLQEDALVKGSLLMYGLPLLTMFASALVGAVLFYLYQWTYTEPFKILFSLIGLFAGFYLIARMNQGLNRNPAYQAVILRKLDSLG
ncbi:MAG: SoxR reducing system RseC family protein [Gammaproteobacteria bacterium]|nr:SoxR reducing system RseC family protein [Gammaproteobacteria bacterium]